MWFNLMCKRVELWDAALTPSLTVLDPENKLLQVLIKRKIHHVECSTFYLVFPARYSSNTDPAREGD